MSFFTKATLLCTGGLCLVVGVAQALSTGTRFTGRTLYRGTKMPAPGLTVEIVEAEDNGEPKDEVLATTRADAAGHFTVVLPQATHEPVALVASAIRTSAESGGDRRQGGYEIKSKRIVLGFLPNPSVAKANLIFIERRKIGHSSDGGDD